MPDMAKHQCSYVLIGCPGARITESSETSSVLQLPCGGLKVLGGPAIRGRAACTLAGPFSPCSPGLYAPDRMLAGVLAALRGAAVAESAGMGPRHTARAELLADTAVALWPGSRVDEILAGARNLHEAPGWKPQPGQVFDGARCRDLATAFLSQAIALRPEVVPVPDRLLSEADQQAEARYELLVELALTAGAGLAVPSPDINPRLELLLSEGRADAGPVLLEIWNEPLWA